MSAIAATEDRQNFDRLVSAPTQSQQTPSLQRATQQYWRPTRRVLDDELESPINGATTIDDLGVLRARSDPDDTLESVGEEPKDTVDLLFEAVYDDSFPILQQVRKDFGFEGLESFEEQQQILGLWHGIIILLGVKAWEIRRWRNEGTLRQNIIQLHEGRGTSSHYFAWFKRNKDILPTLAWLAGRSDNGCSLKKNADFLQADTRPWHQAGYQNTPKVSSRATTFQAVLEKRRSKTHQTL